MGCRHANLHICPYNIMGCGCGSPGVATWAVGMATYIHVHIWVVGVTVCVAVHRLWVCYITDPRSFLQILVCVPAVHSGSDCI